MSTRDAPAFPRELTELHAHVGGSVAPETMWSLAHQNGLKLPTKNYWEFVRFMRFPKGRTLDAFHELFHWTEMIQTGSLAMERCVQETVGMFYRKSNVTKLELRFNPMKRNRGGEHDLDHIIAASLRGMEKACLEYGTQAGIILMMDTRFPRELNEIIAKKALKYRSRGVVGVDIAGPSALKSNFKFYDYREIFSQLKKAGLGITVHAGEEKASGQEILDAIEFLGATRIGHGVQAALDGKILKKIVDGGIVLEFCPTSNLHTGVISGVAEMRKIVEAYRNAGVQFAICSDDPEMFFTDPVRERLFLLENKILSEEEILQCDELAGKASFVRA